MIKLNKLRWDSVFFKKKIGKVLIKSDEDLQHISSLIKNNKKDFDLIYIFSKNEIPLNELVIDNKCSLYIVDRKVVFKKKVTNQLKTIHSKIKNYESNIVNKDLLSLTYQSGIESRYNTDKKFSNKQFKSLYKKWIEESVKGNIAKKVFIYEDNNNILGMVTLDINDNIGSIGLIAVDNSMRGKGIGSLLINKVEDYLLKENIKYLTVATQASNIPACNFYLNNNFLEDEKTYIYHCWL